MLVGGIKLCVLCFCVYVCCTWWGLPVRLSPHDVTVFQLEALIWPLSDFLLTSARLPPSCLFSTESRCIFSPLMYPLLKASAKGPIVPLSSIPLIPFFFLNPHFLSSCQKIHHYWVNSVSEWSGVYAFFLFWAFVIVKLGKHTVDEHLFNQKKSL